MDVGCYHCGEIVPTTSHFSLSILGKERQMCCPGCLAVAETIVNSGLTSYYEYRTEKAEKVDIVPDEIKQLHHYDLQEVQNDFVIQDDDTSEVTLSLEGVTCAACAWLIENQLMSIEGVKSILVNTTTHRARIRWNNDHVALSALLQSITQLGYNAAPFSADEQELYYQRSVKQYLYRIGIAGLATMQVMMLAVALYFEVFSDLDAEFRYYFRWVSLIFATPVLLYSALPFYLNAWRNIKAYHLGMDVPVSLALLLAYGASLVATVTGRGEVFFESVSMFTFFLLVGRFLEMRARHQAATASANLLKLIPTLARKVSGEQILAKLVKTGDRLLLHPGETVPADGIIVTGFSEFDESMLSGESMPVSKCAGEKVFAGTINGAGNIELEVSCESKYSMINTIVRLQDEAQLSKPQLAKFADTVARYFVMAILIISAATWIYWHQHRPDDAFWIMLSVLVATCPCALSLATPTALTCSTSQLSKCGILIRKGHVIETLSKVNHLIVDKTGTLTEGKVKLVRTTVRGDWDENTVLKIAASLESFTSHPIADAFLPWRNTDYIFSEATNRIGHGLHGILEGKTWKIGTWQFVSSGESPDKSVQVWLSCDNEVVAGFHLSDPIRASSPALIQNAYQNTMRVTMLTGDRSDTAQQVATTLGIKELRSGNSPSDKLAYLSSLSSDAVTLMVGDGVNDAPVLAGAHLSVAMGSGTDVAKSSADLVLLGDDLTKLLHAKEVAKHTYRIIRQNLSWALGYNVVILPLAVSGLVAPYIAVLGMSVSSLIVVSNSLRLMK
ncbi:heavy metal translocating P-type ATPase [Thaumasiovibrio sp. DFM-14]|uniref:heavy metal translocating P-type ATPase n=1 Tax=Thaumasiovibrio sp. DFM-14 TaxID=3384792 RepID=UPI0039A0885F